MALRTPLHTLDEGSETPLARLVRGRGPACWACCYRGKSPIRVSCWSSTSARGASSAAWR
jgi:hypothetical protein